MNAHVGFLGEQQLNKNGERLLDLMEECRLIMLNLDESCTGEITREQGMHMSVIDFVLVNELLYKDFIAMDIDEKKDVFDLSGHCMIRIDFKLNTKERDDTTRKSVEYYRVKDDMKARFLQRMEAKLLSKNDDMHDCEFNQFPATLRRN